MRLLVAVAARRKLTLKALAKLCGDRDPRALAKTIRARRPHPHHITELASALGFPAVVGRAFTNQLSVADSRAVIRETIAGELALRFGSGAHAAMIVAAGFTNEALGLADESLVEAARVAALARTGAFNLDGSEDALLGPTLGPIERVLQPRGFSLRAIIGDDAALRVRMLEGLAAFIWLSDVFGITDTQAEELQRILPRLREANDLATTPAEYQRFRLAVGEARRAFDSTFRSRAGTGTLYEAVFGARASRKE
jgi:hypothetical protein